ncbi:MAG: hypothetical protein AB7V43_17025, partial [Acidimicrobiia bacterium]
DPAQAQRPTARPDPAAAQADPTRLPNDTEKVVCTACHDELAPGEWKQRPDGTRQCAPNCHERRTQAAGE